MPGFDLNCETYLFNKNRFSIHIPNLGFRFYEKTKKCITDIYAYTGCAKIHATDNFITEYRFIT